MLLTGTKRICGRPATADRRGIVGVVLAAGALFAIRADKLRGDDACVQAQRHELARPVVRAGACFHGDDAVGGQLPRARARLVST